MPLTLNDEEVGICFDALRTVNRNWKIRHDEAALMSKLEEHLIQKQEEEDNARESQDQETTDIQEAQPSDMANEGSSGTPADNGEQDRDLGTFYKS